jgi:predicted DNA-binding transcriptional regulator AlpA
MTSIETLQESTQEKSKSTYGNAPLTEQQAAAMLGLSVKTLRAWRGRKRGPRFVRYYAHDIDTYIQRCAVQTIACLVLVERPAAS